MDNGAGLLFVTIYINDQRHRTADIVVHLGEMSVYHALSARLVETLKKDEKQSIFHCAVNNRAIRSFPTC